jgi:hypothetical protein
MSALDYRPIGQCPECAQNFILRQLPGGTQVVWEHWTDPCNPFSPRCLGSWRPPQANENEGDAA